MMRFNMFFHGCYAIKFVVCNKDFPTSSAHGQDFKWNYITMANNTSHDLILKKIYMLIIVHPKKCPSR